MENLLYAGHSVNCSHQRESAQVLLSMYNVSTSPDMSLQNYSGLCVSVRTMKVAELLLSVSTTANNSR